MRTTYSKPDVKWDGFRPVVYSLSELALRLPLTQTRRDGDQQLEDDTSIEKLLESLEGRDFQVEDETVAIRITSEMGSLRLKGPTFNCRLASAILELFKNGIKPFASRWFWYDTDESDTDPQTRYKFFVVHEDRIVRESVSFSDYSGSGFDPTVFDSGDGSDDSNWDLAWAAYWYRRFYRETLIGQLMVLRPDLPVIHHYPEGRSWHKLTAPVASIDPLKQIRFLLWVAIALLAFLAFWLIQK
jgi:hypothetical protein